MMILDFKREIFQKETYINAMRFTKSLLIKNCELVC